MHAPALSHELVSRATPPRVSVEVEQPRPAAEVEPVVFRRILALTDFTSASGQAVHLAEQLAALFDADLLLLHVVPDPSRQEWARDVSERDLGELMEDWVREAGARLKGRTSVLDASRVHPVVRLGAAGEEIVRFADESHVDLIVLGKHGTSPLCASRTGLVAAQVQARVSCPVITVPEASRSDARALTIPGVTGERRAIRGVLVPTDFGAASSRALAIGRAVAERSGSALHLLHVVDSPWTRSPAYGPPQPAVIEGLLRAASRRLDREEEAARPGGLAAPRLHTLVRIGDPAVQIVSCAADLGDDLIVMGTHGRGAVARAILGSVARDVLARATGPVVTTGST